MSECLVQRAHDACIPIHVVDTASVDRFLAAQTEGVRAWLQAAAFRARPGSVCALPGATGTIIGYAVGVSRIDELWALGGLALQLPEGDYRLAAGSFEDPLARQRAALGWALGAYQFTRYRKPERKPACLSLESEAERARVNDEVQAVCLVRDLVNTPAEDLMPEHLCGVAADLAERFGAEFSEVVGEELLARGFPAIHAVGRASIHAPRLLDLRWGDAAAPRVTLVGKGVCFDSGGLDIKPSSGMRLMKKDMGGAAHALGVAHMVMARELPVRLRVLVPAVENAISGNAYRPGDVLQTRKGLSVEVDNTDAEGRIVLCDALVAAVEEKPAVLMDFATLTGAARVALGPDLPALFCNDDALAADLLAAAASSQDPLWRMPLHAGYREMLDSRVADILNSASSPYAGAITAALFLQTFVPDEIAWAHFDLMSWNLRNRPGRPEGGEAMGLRAVFECLHGRFGQGKI